MSVRLTMYRLLPAVQQHSQSHRPLRQPPATFTALTGPIQPPLLSLAAPLPASREPSPVAIADPQLSTVVVLRPPPPNYQLLTTKLTFRPASIPLLPLPWPTPPI